MSDYHQDFYLTNYNFDLPEELIAQYPKDHRSSSALLVLDRKTGRISHKDFEEIIDVLPQDCLLVMNTSKVFPARIKGRKARTQGKVEFLLLTPLPLLEINKYNNNWYYANISGLLKPAKRLKQNQCIEFSRDLYLEVLQKKEYGEIDAQLFWQGDLTSLLYKLGDMPLPPYIKRAVSPEDKYRYQTVYAQEEKLGSVAAPTAGLHFTQKIFSRLAEKNIGCEEITLYIGYDTFTPLRKNDIRTHQMHAEYFEINESTAKRIYRAQKNEVPIVAVGTTTVRALESVVKLRGGIDALKGCTDLFIYPGFEFQIVDHILTNFHLPKSSLLIMLSAFAGRKKILETYQRAVQKRYRFFSYGDAMLVL